MKTTGRERHQRRVASQRPSDPVNGAVRAAGLSQPSDQDPIPPPVAAYICSGGTGERKGKGERIQRGTSHTYPSQLTSGAVRCRRRREFLEKGKRPKKRDGGGAGRERSMGKYMRKFRGATGEEVAAAAAAMEVTQVVGVRTRSRSAAATKVHAVAAPASSSRRRNNNKQLLPAAVTRRADGRGSCYLQLRSRMLFMAPPPPPARAPVVVEAGSAGNGAAPAPARVAVAPGLSRCSSTASSVDVAGAQERGVACRSDVAEAGSEHVPEGSASDSGSGRDRERREATPSSFLPGEVSDLESDLAGQKRSRPLPSATATTSLQEATTRPRMPPAAEIEEFFAAAEKAEAKRFAAKYNFDVVRGVPLDAGRFEWTPVVSSRS
uniref:Cyclin-dependent kinase inhibitor domain-containing protein n=1 Tax=Leersia perrieri TaxID=77586 RepID=A0A0D9VLE1_9ORYZ